MQATTVKQFEKDDSIQGNREKLKGKKGNLCDFLSQRFFNHFLS